MRTHQESRDLVRLVEALKEEEELLKDHANCSQKANDQVWAAYDLLTGAVEGSQATRARAAQSHLDALMKESHGHMTSVHHTKVERRWRRLYTDAALMTAFLTLSFNDDEEAKMDAIRDLDMAIIVAGAPGQGRTDLIHRTITALQLRLGRAGSLDGHTCKPDPPLPALIPPCRASKHVKELPELPSISAYMRICRDEPFLIRGAASDWPALQPYGGGGHNNWTFCRWSSADYLKRMSGPGRVVPVEIGSNYTAEDWRQAIVPWSDFLIHSDWCDGTASDNLADKYYLAQHDVFAQFPALLRDVRMPDLVYSSPPAPPYYKNYTPPIDAEDGTETVLLNAWLGPQGTVSPVHRDPYYNCYTQVVGHKLVWIAPSDTPIDISDGIASPAVDVFASPANDDSSGCHPSSGIEQLAMYTVLSPGDTLVMPPGWYHALMSLTRSFSVSMWF